jgi:hypothetical protein
MVDRNLEIPVIRRLPRCCLGSKIMKRFWLFPLVCLFACAGFLSAQNAAPRMAIDQEVYDAGALYQTLGKIEHNFIIKNTGTANLQILKAAPS